MTEMATHEIHYAATVALDSEMLTDFNGVLDYLFDCECGHSESGFGSVEEVTAAAAEHLAAAKLPVRLTTRCSTVYYRIGWREIVCDVHGGIGLVRLDDPVAYVRMVTDLIAEHERDAHGEECAS